VALCRRSQWQTAQMMMTCLWQQGSEQCRGNWCQAASRWGRHTHACPCLNYIRGLSEGLLPLLSAVKHFDLAQRLLTCRRHQQPWQSQRCMLPPSCRGTPRQLLQHPRRRGLCRCLRTATALCPRLQHSLPLMPSSPVLPADQRSGSLPFRYLCSRYHRQRRPLHVHNPAARLQSLRARS
jgi:hypothetical protein